jgi:hypothetical protein
LWEVGSGWGLVHRSEAKMAGMDVGGHREHET